MKILPSKQIPLLSLLLLVLLALQQTIKIGGGTLLSTGIHNSAHGVWFALVTYVIWRIICAIPFLKKTGFTLRLGLTSFIAVLIALLSEFGENVVGREASWEDIFLDMCGMVAVMLAIISHRAKKLNVSGKLHPFLLFIASLMLMFTFYPFYWAAAVTFYHNRIQPRLLDFDTYLGYAVMTTEGESQRVMAPETWEKFSGKKVMKIKLPLNNWPGFRFDNLLSNWQPYSYLVVEIFNDSKHALPITVRVREKSPKGKGAQSFEQDFLLTPGANTLRSPLDLILPGHRKVDLRVHYVFVYTAPRYFGRVLYAGEARLE